MSNEISQLVVHIVIGAAVTFFGAANIVVVVRSVWGVRGMLGDVSAEQKLLAVRVSLLEEKDKELE